MTKTVYVDHASTALPTLFHPRALSWANASNQHALGRMARTMLEQARSQVAQALSAPPESRVVFTAGGTEANNMVLQGGKSNHGVGLGWSFLITTATEHSSVHLTAQFLATRSAAFFSAGGGRNGAVAHRMCDVVYLPRGGCTCTCHPLRTGRGSHGPGGSRGRPRRGAATTHGHGRRRGPRQPHVRQQRDGRGAPHPTHRGDPA